MSTNTISKLPTQIAGFDHVASGGLPEKRTTLVTGTSGSGKISCGGAGSGIGVGSSSSNSGDGNGTSPGRVTCARAAPAMDTTPMAARLASRHRMDPVKFRQSFGSAIAAQENRGPRRDGRLLGRFMIPAQCVLFVELGWWRSTPTLHDLPPSARCQHPSQLLRTGTSRSWAAS